ncbi:MAG: SMC-Scp complex subunit ScpB [Candidatus Buchananbacteria bacterium]
MDEIKNKIESLLFISHKPLSGSEVAKIVDADKIQVEEALEKLFTDYSGRAGGIVILKLDGKYQMATSGASSEIVSKFIKSEITGELTRPSLETLTIIAYRGPISKAELELIRGVNCSLILRNLLMRGLIEAKDDKSRDVFVYSITFDFLKYLGLERVEDLPDFEKLNKNNNLEKLLVGVDVLSKTENEINLNDQKND